MARKRQPKDGTQQAEKVEQVAKALDERGVTVPDSPVTTDVPEGLSAARLAQEWSRLKRFEDRLSKQEENVNKRVGELVEREAKIASDLLAVTAEKKEQTELRTANEKAKAELAARERAVAEKEVKAAAGFADENRRALDPLFKQKDSLLAELAELASRLAEEEATRSEAFQADLDEQRQRAEAELESARRSLATEREELAERERAIHLAQDSLKNEQWAFELEQKLARERRDSELAQHVADYEHRLEQQTRLVATVERQRDQRLAEADSLKRRLREFGDDPEALTRELEQLRDDNARLKNELAVRPTMEEATQLRAWAAERKELLVTLDGLRRDLASAQAAIRRNDIAVNELEVLRDERDSLAQQKQTLHGALEDLRIQHAQLIALDEAKEPFPACSAYDRDADLQRPVETLEVVDLAELVGFARNSMASRGFYYTPEDVRLFIAGLAASRLHLLQGLSGTGKTSLPVEFARAIGAHWYIVEVQAGWRDRDDLLGYYNAFEGRFYESEFTKALYRSLCPSNADRLSVVVLDEMNLSHPEQYFGIMLSKLESSQSAGAGLELMSRPLDNTPAFFQEGSRLPWPSTVWFIGTANHDETTVGFADKTYDRAHVQELPSEHDSFPYQIPKSRPPLGYTALTDAFTRATEKYEDVADSVALAFRREYAPTFRKLGVGWGNRITKQLKLFLPAVLAADGTAGEAADHIFATKIIRKVRDRHDISPDVLEVLAAEIESRWPTVDAGSEPQATLAALEEEIRRLRGSADEFALA